MQTDLVGTSEAVAGNEGVFEVTEKPEVPGSCFGVPQVGSSVTELQVGDRVVPAKSGFGTFRTFATARVRSYTFDVAEHEMASRLMTLLSDFWKPSQPADVIKVSTELPPCYSSLLYAPALAHHLLTSFGDLKAGDVIVNSRAETSVGQCVAQLARARGLVVVNAPTDKAPDEEDSMKLLSELGGTEQTTCQHDFIGTPAFQKIAAELGPVKLALDAYGGGRPTARLVQALG
eukprot:scaffold1638_cov258-Pinguiococcus_pyrenoidosus.AAC.97